ncbi:hypothetical protein LPJ59_004148, partial [Coemansia sp. RSA 2399]
STVYKAQFRRISVQPLSDFTESPSTQSAIASRENHSRAAQLNDLADEISAVLETESVPVLSTWIPRIRKLRTEERKVQKYTGIIYLDKLKAQASTVAKIGLDRLGSGELAYTITNAIDVAIARSKGPVSIEFSNKINIVSPQYSTETFDLPVSAKEVEFRDFSLLSVSAAEEVGHSNYVDWVFSCSQLVVIACRHNLLQSLVQTNPILNALQLHPKVTILLEGIESGKETIGAYTALLQEALPMLGAGNSLANDSRISVVPAASLSSRLPAEDKLDQAWVEDIIQQASQQEMLTSVLDAAVSCIEAGGEPYSATTRTFPPGYQTRHNEYTSQATGSGHPLAAESKAMLDSLQIVSGSDFDKAALSKLSSRIQSEFAESSDLEAIDTSVGAIKQRMQRWFSSGRIWKAVFMKVEEVSDNLVEDAILDRAFEEADLAMVHASGRLNGSIRNAVDDLCKALDGFCYAALSTKEATMPVDPSALCSAKGALHALALRREPVSQFSLARHVWDTRRELAESDTLAGIPKYIRTSLAGFWAINSGSILAGIGSWSYLDAPLMYASSGGAALALLSLVWLRYRWQQLGLRLYRHLDGQSTALSRKVIDAHRSELQSKLDLPVRECVSGISGFQQLIKRDSMASIGGTSGALATNAASWRSRLEHLARA